jgi:hypothetical protein
MILEDNIILHGAPNKLFADRSQVIISNKFLDNLCTPMIGNWQSESQKNQNTLAE